MRLMAEILHHRIGSLSPIIICQVLYISGGAGFLPPTVFQTTRKTQQEDIPMTQSTGKRRGRLGNGGRNHAWRVDGDISTHVRETELRSEETFFFHSAAQKVQGFFGGYPSISHMKIGSPLTLWPCRHAQLSSGVIQVVKCHACHM